MVHSDKAFRPRTILLAAGGLLALLLLAALAAFSESAIDPQSLADRVSQAPLSVKPFLFLFAVLFTAFGFPRQLVAFVTGYVFGFLPGLVVSLLAALLGCILAFFVARRLLRKPIAKRYTGMVRGLDRLIEHDAFLKIIVLRIQPFGTNLLTNLCAGVSAIRPGLFFASTAIGYLPQMIVFTLAGDGIRLGDQSKLLLSGALLVLSVLLGYWLWRRHKVRLVQDEPA